MGKLTKNFNSEEFACSCCKSSQVSAALVLALQELRDLINAPIKINSGYRCPARNKAIGGAKSSKHVTGEAADIWAPGIGLLELYKAAEQLSAFKRGGIGVYPGEGFLHVDVGRERAARWARVDGAYVGINEGLRKIGAKA